MRKSVGRLAAAAALRVTWGAWLGAAAAAACAHAEAQDAPLLQGAGGDVSLTTVAEAPDGRTRVGGALAYELRPRDGFSTRLELNLRAGQAADGVLWPGAVVDPARPWSDLGLGFRADWAALSNARLALAFTDRLFTRPVTASALGGEADAPRDSRSEQGVSLTAALQPASRLGFTLGGELRSASDAMDLAADSGGRALLKTRDGAFTANLAWTLSPRLKLEAGTRLSSTQVAWVEGASAGQDFAAVQPDVTATFTPWSTGALAVGVERAVTPLDAAKFVALARASAAAAGSDLRPDQEWRLHARWTQALPTDARLELGVTEAALQSSTELTRVGADAEAPGSVAGGRRSQYDVALSLPLRAAGLRSMALETRTVWRTSQIVDPLTGMQRPLSGEAPYESTLGLTQTLSRRGVVWGLNTRAQGGQSYYGLNQVSSVETARSLGAFVEYRPQPFAVRLQLDDLAGGERRWTDSWYVDGRDTGALQRVDHREEGGPGFTLSLRRAL